jgi:lysophospholipase L1-like esterase
MDRIAEAFGSDFLCVLQASKRSMYGGRQKRGDRYGAFRTKAKQVLDSHGIAYIDLNEHHAELAVDMFMDDLHLDRRGNGAIARIVAESDHVRIPRE